MKHNQNLWKFKNIIAKPKSWSEYAIKLEN